MTTAACTSGHTQGIPLTTYLSPAQIRGARGMLGWSILDLAKAAELSVSTVRRAEGNLPQPVSGFAMVVVREAMESVGVVFLADNGDGPGMRLRAMDRQRDTNDSSDV